jgi:iron complex outermembrane recepter protein
VKNTTFIMALLSGVSLASISSMAIAQEEDEIVVTAQNRSQNVQDVPIAIDVISAEEFEESGVTNFRDLERLAPALNITNDNQAVQIALRGVGTNSADEAQDTSVVVNIDGEYINRPGVMNMSLFDLERVEVLRGPQGTLQGRNSTGGAINFITRKPGGEFGFNASAAYGNYSALDLEAGVDLPIGEYGGIRLAGIFKEHDGYFSHPGTVDSGTDEASAARASLLLEPNDALTINFALEVANRSAIPENQAFVNANAAGNSPGAGCAGGGGGWVRVAPLYADVLCIPQNTNFQSSINPESYAAAQFAPGVIDQDSEVVRGRVAYDFGGATLTYTGGWRTTSQTGRLGLPVVFRSFTFLDDTETQSHEIRLNGGNEGGFVWQGGAFFFEETLDRESGFYIPAFGGAFLTYFQRDVTSKSKSLFGQVDIPFGDLVTGVAGLRYTDNERAALYGNYPFVIGPPVQQTQAQLDAVLARPPGFPPRGSLFTLGNSEDQLTWLAGLNFEPNADTLIYGKVSTGFKAGGFDSVGPYRPETNTAYEAGLKLDFGDSGQHRFNASTFYYDYKDLQVSVLLNTAVGGQVFNAGQASIWGVEAETVLQVTDNGTFTASVNYLNAEYDELLVQYAVFCVGGCGITGVGDLDPIAPGIQNVNLGGNTPPRSPDWVIAAGYDHVFDLGGAGSLTASLYTRYRSSFFLDIFNYNDSEQSAYTQTDVGLMYEAPSGNWSIQAYGRNLEDERPLTFAGFIAAGPDDIYNFQFGQPRTYGVRLAIDY